MARVDLSTVVGTPVYRAFPFTFDTSGLLTGAAIYTPTIGDILLDAWVEIDTAWNGTTPLGDFGQFYGGEHIGWYADWTSAVDMTDPDLSGGQLSPAPMLTQGNAAPHTNHLLAAVTSGGVGSNRGLPAKFTTTDPVKVVVSQDGTNIGADPGSSQGAAVLYLVTVTPLGV